MGENGCHAAECALLPVMVAMDTDVDGMLVLRALLSSSAKTLQERLSFMSSSENNPNNVLDADDLSDTVLSPVSGDKFSCIFNLEGNISKRPPEDVLEATITATLLLKIIRLKLASDSDDKTVEVEKKDELNMTQLGGLILHLILKFQCNAHCIKELQLKSDELVMLSKLAIIGYGLYCNLSLVNHSCNPNVLHSTSGKIKFLYATSIINKGEEICDSYGERFVSHNLLERKESIEKTYYFQCDCIACINDWPLFDQLPLRFSLRCFKCSNAIDKETSKCNSCNISYNIQNKQDGNKKSKKSKQPSPHVYYDATETKKKIASAWDKYNSVTNGINSGKYPDSEDFKVLREINKLLAKYSVHPNKPLIQVQEFLMRYYDLQAAVAKVC